MPHERPSATAITIALALLALQRRRDGEKLVDDEDARLLRRELRRLGGAAGSLAHFASSRLAAPAARFLEQCTVPGIIRHFGVRKRLIRQIVERAIGEGARRVVVLGAGLDLLTLHLAHSFKDLVLVEIDHPGTLPAKRQMLDDAGPAAQRITLLGADLSQSEVAALLTDAPGAGSPTLFIAEGLTMYLTGAQVGSLFERLSSIPGAARLVFTFLEPGPDGWAAFPGQRRALGAFLRRSRERFKWGCRCENLAEFVASHHWRLRTIHGAGQFGPGFVGEYIAECEVCPGVTLGA